MCAHPNINFTDINLPKSRENERNALVRNVFRSDDSETADKLPKKLPRKEVGG